MSDARVAEAPRATYRLQLTPEFGFAAAAGLVGYLGDLGVSHLYLSPVLQARPGSTHGYDVADPTRVSEELGGEEGLRALAAAAHAAGMGVVVDIVPNHLGTGFATPLWRALLEHGRSGPAGSTFDVDWATPLPGAADKVVLPVLGDQYGVVLHRGELAVVEEDGELRVAYFDHRFPLSPESAAAVERAGGPAALVGRPEEPDRYARLHALLEMQHHRLIHWRAGEGLINYRRFFSIDELAGVRVEDDAVFDQTHAKILELAADGVIDGLRVDHPDGLRDPARYLARLADATGGIWTVAEKITAPDEPLRHWPVAGTTGYEFANQALGLFVDPAAEDALDELDEEFGGSDILHWILWDAKEEVLLGELAPDVTRLVRLLWSLSQAHLEHRDTDDIELRSAVVGLICSLDVYRTYVDPRTGTALPDDEARVDAAVADLRETGERAGLLRFLADLLLGRVGTDPAHLEVIARFPQVSSAAMAKGVEDTAFYRHRSLMALNEVGGDPGRLGIEQPAFHAAQAQRQERSPLGMVTTATHDTKRGEDTRMRMAALSELPERWAATARRWWEEHQRNITRDGDYGPLIDAQTASLVYQTLVGVWPVDGGPLEPVRERVQAYVVKACREAKERTSWRDPDPEFEAATAGFVDALFADDAFCAEMARLAGACAQMAVVSGLAQVLLRCTVPGVPDTYQGTEVWDLSLVDPDNRRPVDFGERRRVLAELDAGGTDPAALFGAPHDGRVKTWVLSRALRARRDHPACVGADGAYEPLAVEGRWADRVVAFARVAADDTLVTVAPRLASSLLREAGAVLGGAWDDTAVALPHAGPWEDLLTGRRHPGDRLALSEALTALPVVLLAPARP